MSAKPLEPQEVSGDRLRADRVTIGYDARVISQGLSVTIPDNEFTVIIGPNACGKSTLLRALARMLSPTAGAVLLDGQAISSYPSKEVARRLGLLPQSSVAPDGITVADLVARGRYPHQRLLRQWSKTDEQIVAEALAATNVRDLADRSVDELSGGQRQRVWLAMALASSLSTETMTVWIGGWVDCRSGSTSAPTPGTTDCRAVIT